MNDDTQTNGPAMHGDDELAKTLSNGLKFEDTPGPMDNRGDDSSGDDTPPSMNDMPAPDSLSSDGPATDDVAPTPPVQVDADNDEMDHETVSTSPAIATTAPSSDLDQLKSSALDDLKPLVGKLNQSPEEKFDTLLLIIRSTDDQSLLAEAHAAAKQITDDAKRAQALLDIIKEVDYFNGKKG